MLLNKQVNSNRHVTYREGLHGGEDTTSNLVCLCEVYSPLQPCHEGKLTRTLVGELTRTPITTSDNTITANIMVYMCEVYSL